MIVPGYASEIKAGLHVRRKHKHLSRSASINHVWTGTTQTQAQEKGTRALVLASSRFTHGLCLYLCLCLRRTCIPALVLNHVPTDPLMNADRHTGFQILRSRNSSVKFWTMKEVVKRKQNSQTSERRKHSNKTAVHQMGGTRKDRSGALNRRSHSSILGRNKIQKAYSSSKRTHARMNQAYCAN